MTEAGRGVGRLADHLADPVADRIAAWTQRAADRSLRVLRRCLFPLGRPPTDPRRVLVHLVGNVGDVVVAAPMLQALGRRYPDAGIELLTSAGRGANPGAAEVLRGFDHLQTIRHYDVDRVKRPKDLWRLVRELRKARPDLVVLCPTSLNTWRQGVRNLAFARLIGPRHVVGVGVPTIRWALGSQVRVRRYFPHESQRYLGLIRELGIPDDRRPTVFGDLEPESKQRIDDVTPAGRFVAVCPGGKQVPHRWPESRFVAVVAELTARTDVRFVAVGNEAERDLCERVLAPAGDRAHNAAGSLDLRETTELLGRGALLLTNDTGPMHLAAAVGTPVVAVFGGAMPPGRWFPWVAGATVIRAEAACLECLGRPDRPHCVDRIGTGVVLEACLRAIDASPAGGSDPFCDVVDPSGDHSRIRIIPTATGWQPVP